MHNNKHRTSHKNQEKFDKLSLSLKKNLKRRKSIPKDKE